MEDKLTFTTPTTDPSAVMASIRASLFGNRVTLDEIAKAIGGCERSARNLMHRLAVPYIKVKNVRLYDRDVVRARLLAGEINLTPRGRGRPRKAA